MSKQKVMEQNDSARIEHLEQMLADKGYTAICGVDEVGRGPLAGPVVAAAVIMSPSIEIEGLTDSKKLSAFRREIIFEKIVELGLPCAVGILDHECIDRMNILRASLMAMRKAVIDLSQVPDIILVDGTHPIPNLDQPQFAVVGGDYRCRSISAASIVAKITRDRIMDKYQALFPSFSFSKHKGYPTPDHIEELREFGPTEIHRKSFKPVAELIDDYALL